MWNDRRKLDIAVQKIYYCRWGPHAVVPEYIQRMKSTYWSGSTGWKKMNISQVEMTGNSPVALAYRLDKATQYIGELNVQIKEMKSVFSVLKKYPRNKKEFINILKFFSAKALGIISADWVQFRIIDSVSLRTLTESIEGRGGKMPICRRISNTALLKNRPIDDLSIVGSGRKDMPVKAFCILPTKEMKSNQRILIESLTSLLEMVFVIYRPEYIENRRN